MKLIGKIERTPGRKWSRGQLSTVKWLVQCLAHAVVPFCVKVHDLLQECASLGMPFRQHDIIAQVGGFRSAVDRFSRCQYWKTVGGRSSTGM